MDTAQLKKVYKETICSSLQAFEYLKRIQVGRIVTSELGIYHIISGINVSAEDAKKGITMAQMELVMKAAGFKEVK